MRVARVKVRATKRLARSRVSLSEKATMQSKFVSKNEAHRAQGPVASREGCRWCRHMLARDGYGYMTTDPAREKVPGGQGLQRACRTQIDQVAQLQLQLPSASSKIWIRASSFLRAAMRPQSEGRKKVAETCITHLILTADPSWSSYQLRVARLRLDEELAARGLESA